MRLVGLTGGIATGKSTVVSQLIEDGVTVIDCDVLAAAAVEKGKWGYRRVVAAFGTSILKPEDDSIDREKLGALVFSGDDDVAGRRLRRKLNAATHLPIFLSLLRSILACWLSCKLVAVVDMPLLYESGFWPLTRPRVLVACGAETQVRRVRERDALGEREARARVAAQAPAGPKAARSHCVIENDGEGGVDELKRRVSRILVWGEGGEGEGEEEERQPGQRTRRRRRRRRRGLLFRNCLWHALLTPPALAAAAAVVVALCSTKAR